MKPMSLLIFILTATSLLNAQAKYIKELSGFLGVRDCAVSWADIDNDNDLDFIISGDTATSINQTKPYTAFYRNDGSSFSLQGTIIRNFSNTSIAWGDYDNDNAVDLLIAGIDESEMAFVELYRNNGSGTFTLVDNLGTFWGVTDPKVAWADFDNDGDQDVLVAGEATYAISVYENKYPSAFEKHDLSVNGLDANGMVTGDFNNDGAMDFIFGGENSGVKYCYLYKNMGSFSFTAVSIIVGLSECSFAAGDIDNDGVLDLLALGTDQSGTPITRAYLNNGAGSFSISSNLYGLTNGSIALGDCDGDMSLDVAFTGNDGMTDTMLVYNNSGSGTFTPWVGGEEFDGIDDGKIAFGDYDNDGRLDILVSGSEYEDDTLYVPVTNVFKKTAIGFVQPNEPPTSSNPNLQEIVTGNEVTLSWDKYIDEGQSRNDLSYNIDVYKTSTGKIIIPILSNLATGRRLVVQAGNTGLKNTSTLKNLSSGEYTWRVQAIDNSYEASSWSISDTFTINASNTITVTFPNGGDTLEPGTNRTITWNSNTVSIPNVSIKYSTNSGTDWINVYGSINNTGSFDWEIPKTLTTTARVKISDVSDPSTCDSSDADFNIRFKAPTCSTHAVSGTNITANSALLSGDVFFTFGDSTETNLSFEISTDGSAWSGNAYSGNPIKYTGTYTYQKNGLNPGTFYYYRLRVMNINGENEGNTVTFETLDAAPSFSQVTYPSSIQKDTKIDIYATIDNLTAVDSVYIRYAGFFQNENIEPMLGSGTNWSYEIPSGLVGLNGMWFNIFVKRSGANISYYPGPGQNDRKFIKVLFDKNTLDNIKVASAFPNGLPSDGWNTFSLPYDFTGGVTSISLSDIFGTQLYNSNDEPTNWEALIVQAGLFDHRDVVEPKKGYFIYHTMGNSMHIDESYTSFTTNIDYDPMGVTVNQGWNLIPWPLLQTANFAHKTGNPPPSGKLWICNKNGWIPDYHNDFNFKLKPFGAYAFYVDNPASTTLNNIITITSTSMMSKPLSEGEWKINFKGYDGKYYDYCNEIGTSLQSDDQVDAFDEPEPFALGKIIRGYLIQKQNSKNHQLCSDFRRVGNAGYSWDMNFDNPGNEPTIELTWSKTNVPAGLSLVLVDFNNNEIIDLNAVQNYSFKASAENPFKIIAGNDSYITQEIDKLNLPDKFTLYANYPNPFNPGTTIKYDLRLASNIKLSVYNTLGQLVRTLVNGAVQTTGTYTVAWDGKDQLGRMASTGVYIYRLDVKDINGKTFTKSHKMLLIK